MLSKAQQELRSRVSGMVVLSAGLAVIAGSALWLILTGNIGIRYSADHDGTIPMWLRWIPALVGIVLIRLAPPAFRNVPSDTPAGTPRGRALRLEAAVLLAAAVLFAATLWLVGGGEPEHTMLKLPLLLGVPAVMFWILRRRGTAWAPGREEPGPWRRYGPAVPVVAWLALSYAGPLATPPSDYALTVDLVTLIITVAVVFLLNSLLEEVFYRRWLQTRWEFILGRWPAIVLASSSGRPGMSASRAQAGLTSISPQSSSTKASKDYSSATCGAGTA